MIIYLLVFLISILVFLNKDIFKGGKKFFVLDSQAKIDYYNALMLDIDFQEKPFKVEPSGDYNTNKNSASPVLNTKEDKIIAPIKIKGGNISINELSLEEKRNLYNELLYDIDIIKAKNSNNLIKNFNLKYINTVTFDSYEFMSYFILILTIIIERNQNLNEMYRTNKDKYMLQIMNNNKYNNLINYLIKIIQSNLYNSKLTKKSNERSQFINKTIDLVYVLLLNNLKKKEFSNIDINFLNEYFIDKYIIENIKKFIEVVNLHINNKTPLVNIDDLNKIQDNIFNTVSRNNNRLYYNFYRYLFMNSIILNSSDRKKYFLKIEEFYYDKYKQLEDSKPFRQSEEYGMCGDSEETAYEYVMKQPKNIQEQVYNSLKETNCQMFKPKSNYVSPTYWADKAYQLCNESRQISYDYIMSKNENEREYVYKSLEYNNCEISKVEMDLKLRKKELKNKEIEEVSNVNKAQEIELIKNIRKKELMTKSEEMEEMEEMKKIEEKPLINNCIPDKKEKNWKMWGTTSCQEMQEGWEVCTNEKDVNHKFVMKNCPMTCANARGEQEEMGCYENNKNNQKSQPLDIQLNNINYKCYEYE